MQNDPDPGTTGAAPPAMEHLVFVFGTLKEGFPNFTVNRGVRVPGSFSTCSAYPLYLVGERNVPWMIDRPGEGQSVAGQVFRVDNGTLAAMDRLERITEPDGYRRAIVALAGGETAAGKLLAYAYLKPAEQLVAAEIRKGPLGEYSHDDAALYRPRS
jgi:gamma-glutamylaminecyclotransferase